MSILDESLTPHTCRNFVKNSDDALQSGALEFENVARVKRFLDAFGLSDVPLAVGSDCTKVRVRLSYSNDQGCHILGSTLPLSECVVEDADDIDALVRRVEEEKAFTTQTRAIMIKVSPSILYCSTNPSVLTLRVLGCCAPGAPHGSRTSANDRIRHSREDPRASCTAAEDGVSTQDANTCLCC